MIKTKSISGSLFLYSALGMLVLALCFGLLSAAIYLVPDFLKNQGGFASLRPLHVSSALFWILLGATGCAYSALESFSGRKPKLELVFLQWALWWIAVVGIFISYLSGKFGGREYWEFPPIWALFILLAWGIFVFNLFPFFKGIREWPVYVWMWMTGSVFFLFIFIENYLWLLPAFAGEHIRDATVQWKVNGSMVGAWNQLLYGTLFYLMDRISGGQHTGRSRVAFIMYFLGLFNLMFNWGHHIYTLPTEAYVKYFGYAVSMTEWIFLFRIFYNWKGTLNGAKKYSHHFSYWFCLAAEFWVLVNLCQALLMSIPAINVYTHGTHVTVAHAMGTTIGINSMILFAVCFEFLVPMENLAATTRKKLNRVFWFLQFSLFVFWLSLLLAGIQKGFWQRSGSETPYSKMMDGLQPYFIVFGIAGLGLALSMITLIDFIFRRKETPVKNA